MSEDLERLVLNGIDGATGRYLLDPVDPEELVRGLLPALRLAPAVPRRPISRNVLEGVDARDLAATGWALVCPHDVDPAILEALAPLLAHRQAQAGAQQPQRFRVLTGADGLRPGDTKLAFLERHMCGPGPVDPDVLPYYLLLIGDPERVPFALQTQLDLQFAVGRLHFATPDEYAAYACNLVAAEHTEPPARRDLHFFATEHSGDPATALGARFFERLAAVMQPRAGVWDIGTSFGERATRATLGGLLGGPATPSLLVTASHGLGFPCGDPRQAARQGALLCQDWPGPGSVPDDSAFAGEDLGAAEPRGLVALHFSCFSGGTPRLDQFSQQALAAPPPLAPRPFLADLPRRMLARGALAVIAHVDRVWSCSLRWARAGTQIATFRGVLDRLIGGHPVGSALEPFAARYGELAAELLAMLGDPTTDPKRDAAALASLWTAHNDARNYIVLGDPAARLPVAAPRRVARQPIVGPVTGAA